MMKTILWGASMVSVALAIAPAAHAACANCGIVAELKTVQVEGEGSGLGAVAGGVIGGVLGHQVGGGRGKDLATVAGAVGGAYAGHQIEKSQKTATKHQVVVKMDEGKTRYFNFSKETSYKVGDKVQVVEGKLVRMK